MWWPRYCPHALWGNLLLLLQSKLKNKEKGKNTVLGIAPHISLMLLFSSGAHVVLGWLLIGPYWHIVICPWGMCWFWCLRHSSGVLFKAARTRFTAVNALEIARLSKNFVSFCIWKLYTAGQSQPSHGIVLFKLFSRWVWQADEAAKSADFWSALQLAWLQPGSSQKSNVP